MTDYNPDSFELEQKGPMKVLYSVTGKAEREHVASFFHDHKADYVLEAIKAHYGVKIVKKRATAAEVKPTKAKPSKAKTATVSKAAPKKRAVVRKKK